MAGPLNSDGSRRGPRSKGIGDLRHRVRIDSLDENARDESGAVVPVWVEVATVWASVEPVGGRESLINGQVQANVTHLVLMRLRDDVTAKNRLIWLTGPGGSTAPQTLNIDRVGPAVGSANSLELMCVREEV